MKKQMKGLAKAFLAASLATSLSFFATSCASSKAETNLGKIDMTKWQYNSEDDVFYQLGIEYAETIEDSKYQTLGIFVPGAYFSGTQNDDGTYTVAVNKKAKIKDFTAKNAPYIMPIETPGYAELEAPTEYTKAVADYTNEGMIFIFSGARGRTHGAPYGVTDFKAAIRYVRYNKDILPGNTERYFTYGMSGGGAQSALLGATGDAAEYEPYLKAMGAVQGVSDAVMGSMDWCPITNLNIANEAYEWELGMGREGLDKETQELSNSMAQKFASYITSLGLKDENGTILSLEKTEDGLYRKGSYYDYLKSVIETSLNNFLSDTKFPYNPEEQKNALEQKMLVAPPFMRGGNMGERNAGAAPGMPSPDGAGADFTQRDNVSRINTTSGITISGTYNTVEDYIKALNAEEEWVYYDKNTNKATIKDVESFMKALKVATKKVGAFDDLEESQGENTLFGYNGEAAHWDSIMAGALEEVGNLQKAAEYKEDLSREDALGYTVDYRINLYNPMYYLSPAFKGYKTATPAKYWRIRSGIFQGDTAISTELDYALALRSYGKEVKDVDFETVWGLYHVMAERSGATTDNFIAWVKDCLSK